MTIYKEIIFDAETGKETKIEFTKKELEEYNAKLEAAQAQAQAEAEAQAIARAEAETKLAALGLTAEDLKALLG